MKFMEFFNMEWQDLVIPISVIIGGFLLGFIVEKLVQKKLIKIALRTKWEGDEIIILSLKNIIFFLSGIFGLYIALLHLSTEYKIPEILYRGILASVILFITLFLARLGDGFVKLWTKSAEGKFPSISIFPALFKLSIFTVGLLVILQTFGISIAPILTALGIGGLAVALALRDTLANLFAGIHIIASRQIKPGDYIKLNTGEEGYVEDITWRNTILKALGNNAIIVPNEKLAGAIITNYFKPNKILSVSVDVGVSYDSDLEKVERVSIEVAKEVVKDVKGGYPEIEPFVRFKEFGDSSINFTVIMKARQFVDQYVLKHEFIKRLHKRFQKEGIEIPYPITTVYLKNTRKKKKK